MAPSFLLLHVITNEKSLKFTQIGRLLSASRASPQKHVPSTLVGIPVDIYTLLKSIRKYCDEMQIPSRDAYYISRREELLGLTPGGLYYYAETLIKGTARRCRCLGCSESRSR